MKMRETSRAIDKKLWVNNNLKTTLFFDVADSLYGEDGGLLISVGEEPRAHHIPNAFCD